MPVFIHNIATLVPEHAHNQDYACEKMQSWFEDAKTRRVIRRIYKHSGIDRRYSVIDDFTSTKHSAFFKYDAQNKRIEPSTQERNDCFITNAKCLSTAVAAKVIKETDGFTAQDITHLITVSCTGFYSPGPDFNIVTALGLSGNTERYHLGFMGCYAAFPALRMAQQFCTANSQAVVLVVCLELCTLHLQVKPDIDTMLANALFADGAGAALGSARTLPSIRPVLKLETLVSNLAPEGKNDMAWDIGNTGFNLVLSSYVPKIIATHISALVDKALKHVQRQHKDINLWAIHPGGRSILDKVQANLALKAEQLKASRTILREYGNMSSATILFVLKEILNQTSHQARQTICAMAFGPGLTIELGALELCQLP